MSVNKFLLISAFICLILTTPTIIVKAQELKEGVVPGVGSFGIDEPVGVEEPGQLLNILAGTVKWVYTVFFIVAVIFILFAAFNYLSGGDNPEKLKTARNQIIYAVIAIAVALLAVGASAIVREFLKNGAVGNAVPQTPIKYSPEEMEAWEKFEEDIRSGRYSPSPGIILPEQQ
jgi:fumarate reductase subunit D